MSIRRNRHVGLSGNTMLNNMLQFGGWVRCFAKIADDQGSDHAPHLPSVQVCDVAFERNQVEMPPCVS